MTTKKSFKKDEATEEAPTTGGLTEEEAEQLAGAPDGRERNEQADRSSAEQLLSAEGGAISGDTEDVRPRLPRLNIVQKVGPLGDKFNKGELILNQEELVANLAKESVQVTCAKALFFYEEIVPYDEDRIPERAKDVNEVYQRGGEVRWQTGLDGKPIKPTWQHVAEVLFCLRAPEGKENNPSFPFVFNEEGDRDNGSYTFALMKLKGAGFTSAGKELITANSYYFRDGLDTGAFNMTAPLTQFRTGNSSYVCTLRKSHNHSSEFCAWLRQYRP